MHLANSSVTSILQSRACWCCNESKAETNEALLRAPNTSGEDGSLEPLSSNPCWSGSPANMKELSDFEGRRSKNSGPLTHVELFKDLLLNSIPLQQENWDNLASDQGEFGKTGGVSSETATFEKCSQACEADPNCFQYSHHGNTGQIGMSVRLGYKREVDSEGVWRNGWHKARLADWVSKQPACDKIKFPAQLA